MRIAIAGTGYVGLVTAVCLAERGHNVTCVDVDANKIAIMQQGISPIYEEGLPELMKKNADRIVYTLDYESAYNNAEVIFIGVGTPEKKDGSANLNYVWAVVKNIAESVNHKCVVVVKSTVPIGTNEKVEKYLEENKRENAKFSVVSNPEFLAQGTAVHDTLFASRIVIGANNQEAADTMMKVYENFDVPKLITDRQSAEMIKYASNDFLALKISYINEIANLCEQIGADINDVATGMGFDTRIGNKFLNAGIGYGGSCFPKDTKALHWISAFYDKELKTVKAAIEVNDQQKLKLIKKAKAYYESFAGLKIAVLGLTFKPGTDDLREAPSLVNIPIFLEDGAEVYAYDPVGENNYKKLYPTEITYCQTPQEALKDADICFIFTEWPEIKALTLNDFALMKKVIILDGRNCFALKEMEVLPIAYESIGRRAIRNI
ncbi:UDP-glucose dehydrogenase family protein [Phascolarctobacterium sp.]|uniref:UDP-glucose dehydrogenase family protein n=1 Tax=Phascolarctobacterium sp. TaxID=2049039 RepID=UPI00386875AA